MVSASVWLENPYILKCFLTSHPKNSSTNFEPCFISSNCWSSCSCSPVNGIKFYTHCILLLIYLQLNDVYRCDVSRLIVLSYNSYFIGNRISNLRAHVVYTLRNGQPYCILIPSQNFFKSQPYSFNGYAFNQF